MPDDSLTREQRDEIVAELYRIFDRRYPDDRAKKPSSREDELLRERYYLRLGEYSDRLPRTVMSVCPFCDTPLVRSIDPFGLDGHWWHVNCDVRFEEPQACPHFQLLLGALDLRGRIPIESRFPVKPGPDVPFVVPEILSLPGMIAVVARLPLQTGDIAYPIAYFSDEEIDPASLQQRWCRDSHWFKDGEGNVLWLIANHPYDFDLDPYLASGRLRWADLDAEPPRLGTAKDGPCPLVGLPGERECQELGGGERDLIGLPDGEPIIPFEDVPDDEWVEGISGEEGPGS